MTRVATVKHALTNNWRTKVAWLILVGATVALYITRLARLTGGASIAEVQYITDNNSVTKLAQTPAFLIHRTITYTLHKVGAEQLWQYRLVSVAVGLLAVFSMFYILRHWYTSRVSLLGSLMFATSTMVLHASRLALPDVSFLLIAPIIAVGLWLQRTKRYKRALLVLIVCLCLTVYTPGFVWIAVAVFAWQGRRIMRVLARSSIWTKLVSIIVVVALLTPLAISGYMHPRSLLSVVGLPSQLGTVSWHLDHIKTTLFGIFGPYRPQDALFWVEATPWFDVFAAAMLVLGIYSLRFERALVRSRLQLGLLAAFGVLILIGGPVTYIAIAPVVYLMVAGGVAFMLQQWFTVFPRNPIARVLAVSVLGIVIGMSAYYNTYRYFVAWPSTIKTSAAFTDNYLIK